MLCKVKYRSVSRQLAAVVLTPRRQEVEGSNPGLSSLIVSCESNKKLMPSCAAEAHSAQNGLKKLSSSICSPIQSYKFNIVAPSAYLMLRHNLIAHV